MPAFFITGTDTDVGKTYFSAWLVRQWRTQGQEAAGLKPISAGDNEDAKLLHEASGKILSLAEINPVHLREPAAPLAAARAEDRIIDFPALNQGVAAARKQFSHLAVEGVGGWRVPLAPSYDVRDWARELKLPVVVVALNRLGMLNHTILTVESIHAAGLTCAGIVVNEGPDKLTETQAEGPTAVRSTPTAVRQHSPDFDFARSRNVGLLREILLLPVFEFDRRAEAAGHVPLWLGGKEV